MQEWLLPSIAVGKSVTGFKPERPILVRHPRDVHLVRDNLESSLQ